mgnify:CR=1 FL=1
MSSSARRRSPSRDGDPEGHSARRCRTTRPSKSKRSPASHGAVDEAEKVATQALALDSEFALPYVGLADYHFALAAVGGSPSHEAMPRARELAQRALEIDPDLPEAHAMLGIVAGHYDYDWREAERRFHLAVKREPLSPHLRQWYGTFFLFATGRADEARLQLSRVIEEDPLCQMWRLMRANLLPSVGLEHEALDDARKAVELDPDAAVHDLDRHIVLFFQDRGGGELLERQAVPPPLAP